MKNVLIRELSPEDEKAIENLMEYFNEKAATKAILKACQRYIHVSDREYKLQTENRILKGQIESIRLEIARYFECEKRLINEANKIEK